MAVLETTDSSHIVGSCGVFIVPLPLDWEMMFSVGLQFQHFKLKRCYFKFSCLFPLIRLVLLQLFCGKLIEFACILAMALHSYRKYSFFAFATLQRFLLLAYESHLVMHSPLNFSAICNLFLPFKTFIALSGLDQIR